MDMRQQKAWMAQWRSAGEALAAVRQEELARMSDAEAEAAVLALGDLPSPELPASPTSGLVEQQRLFHAVRRVNPA